jgi:hypothetical protein
MTVALTEALELAKTLHDNSTSKKILVRELESYAARSLKNFLHARFIGIWVAILFINSESINRLAKWGALQRYNKNETVRKNLVHLFSGHHQREFAIYDIPYYLGLFPTRVRKRLDETVLQKQFHSTQNDLITMPFKVQKKLLKGKALKLLSYLANKI